MCAVHPDMSEVSKAEAARPLLKIDRKSRKLFKPYQETAPAKALAWFGQAGDQLQLRVLSGGVVVMGLLRRDARLLGAGLRMIIAHELATLAKKAAKNRVDRWRPKNAGSGKDVKPRKGHSKEKALNSFPSGHSAGSMAVASAFASAYPEHRVPALAAGGAVSLAQIPTASHYPSDVAAGAAIGVATNVGLALVLRLLRRLRRG